MNHLDPQNLSLCSLIATTIALLLSFLGVAKHSPKTARLATLIGMCSVLLSRSAMAQTSSASASFISSPISRDDMILALQMFLLGSAGTFFVQLSDSRDAVGKPIYAREEIAGKSLMMGLASSGIAFCLVWWHMPTVPAAALSILTVMFGGVDAVKSFATRAMSIATSAQSSKEKNNDNEESK